MSIRILTIGYFALLFLGKDSPKNFYFWDYINCSQTKVVQLQTWFWEKFFFLASTSISHLKKCRNVWYFWNIGTVTILHVDDKRILKKHIMMYPTSEWWQSLAPLVEQWHLHYMKQPNIWKCEVRLMEMKWSLKIFRIYFLYLVMVQSALTLSFIMTQL